MRSIAITGPEEGQQRALKEIQDLLDNPTPRPGQGPQPPMGGGYQPNPYQAQQPQYGGYYGQNPMQPQGAYNPYGGYQNYYGGQVPHQQYPGMQQQQMGYQGAPDASATAGAGDQAGDPSQQQQQTAAVDPQTLAMYHEQFWQYAQAYGEHLGTCTGA